MTSVCYPSASTSTSADPNLGLALERGNARKRSMEDSSPPVRLKMPRYKFYFQVQSDTSDKSEDTESIYSVQGYETEVVQDTPDTDTKSEGDDSPDSDDLFDVEYEVAEPSSDDENNLIEQDSSGTDDCVMAAVSDAIAAAICDNSLDWLTDGEESDNSSASQLDAEPNMTGFGACVQCKAKNDSMYRYCQRCFQKKKNSFPPRPKGRQKKRRKEQQEQHLKKLENTPSSNTDITQASTSTNMASSQDSGISISNDFSWLENRQNLKRKRNASNSETEEVGKCTVKRTKTDNSLSELKELCIICNNHTKNSIFVHGTIGHMCCCYKCAIRTWTRSKKCLVCNCKVKNIVKVFVS